MKASDGGADWNQPAMTMKVVIVGLLLAAVGCGGMASVTLKPPLTQACAKSGLRGCEELTDGILLYAEGDSVPATKAIISVAAQNGPAEIQTFIAALKLLNAMPGASSYMGPIMEVVAILEGVESHSFLKVPHGVHRACAQLE